ncbi:SRPBCC family protein [Massilia sp. TS11]|uniref:SRPBCC family protein n=1 Tax=Massilia sp. TS11 TaxID=2908003 RepID=UPI001EDBD8E6|nr:SRPBCC family protein [Massilia sp. TS11]MCG2585776.1 SRPBCC family protein [Massilia sp. TS11]
MLRACLLGLLLCWALSARAGPIAVQVARQDELFSIQASLTVRADPFTVWRVLTDYERMPEFVPDLRRARILARDGHHVRLEQFGTASWLFFARDIHLFVDVRETPISSIDISLAGGDMRHYNCRWEFDLAPEGGTRIRYSGRLAPNFSIPRLLGNTIVRADIERMLQAVRARLEGELQAR